jgi:hypothetical protein
MLGSQKGAAGYCESALSSASTAAAARFHATISYIAVLTMAGLSTSASSTRCRGGVTPLALW